MERMKMYPQLSGNPMFCFARKAQLYCTKNTIVLHELTKDTMKFNCTKTRISQLYKAGTMHHR